jgi:lysophospholipase L1-like esterase
MRFIQSAITLVFMICMGHALAFACPLVGGHVDFNCDGKHRMTFTGDSITRGIGDKDRTFETGGYVLDMAEANPESAMLNLGDPGSTAGRLFRTLRRNIQNQAPKVIQRMRNLDAFQIEIGTNDYWKGTQPKKIVRNVKRILEFLTEWYEVNQGTVAPIFVIATLPPTKRGYQNPYITHVNNGLLAASSPDFPVEIRFDKLKSNIISNDTLHPSARGYARMTKKVQKWLDGKGTERSLALRSDGDADGIYDELEALNFGTDPLLPDTDGDGLLDGDEVFTHETNPVVTDTDGDGTSDSDEVTNGTDPNDAASK